MLYKGKSELLYLLLSNGTEYYRVLYDLKSNKFESIKEDDLLNLICCNKDTLIASIRIDALEEHAQIVRKLWEEKHVTNQSEKEKLERICALLLIPESKGEDFEEMVRKGVVD